MSLDYSFNPEQTDNLEYEQYRSENERNYETYGQNSTDEEEASEFVHADVTYGQDADQESFSLCTCYVSVIYVLTLYLF